MLLFSIIATFLSTGLFQWWNLIEKRLLDKGIDKLGIFYYQMFSVIPGFILLAFTYKQEYITFLADHPKVLAAVTISAGVWMIHVYLRMFATAETHSMAFLNAFNAIISIPLYLLIGILINGDHPNIFNFLGLLALAIALSIQPTPHTQNTRRGFHKKNIVFLIAITFLGHAVDALNQGLYRYFLQNIHAILFGLALSMVISMSVIVVFISLKKGYHRNIRKDITDYSYWIIAMPVIWVIGSIFEGFSVANIPIYTLIALASFTFVIDVLSDIKNRRIHFDSKTIFFILLVFGGNVLSVASLYT